MRLAEEEHTHSGLADTAADGEGELIVKQGLMEGEIRSFHTAALLKLGKESLAVNSDTHGGKLECYIKHGVVNEDIAV